MSHSYKTICNKTARRQWAELNTDGFPSTTELRQALADFDSGDESAAVADCEEWNRFCVEGNGIKHLDLDDWYGGIEDAIEEREKHA